MTPVVVLLNFGSLKKQLIIVCIVMLILFAMPIMAVFSLGSGTLKFLFNSIDGSNSVSALSLTTQGIYDGPEIPGDAYAWGNCTYWAFALRLKAGDPIPTTWGNADTWDDGAKKDGYLVDHIPEPNAIMQTDAGNLGHVAYVTDVDPVTGNWTISEMNVKGIDIVDIATYPATSAQYFNFIHDKVVKSI